MSQLAHKKDNDFIRIKGELELIILREDDCFVAYCQALELSSHGETVEEAKKNFKEVLDIFLDDITERGTASQVLEECGWSKMEEEATWTPPSYISRETFPLSYAV